MTQRIRVQDDPVVRRPVPLDHLLITATSSGGAQTLYTVRDNAAFEIKKLTASNLTGSAATLTLHSIPSGGSIGDSNAEMKGVSIPPNTSAALTEYIMGLYDASTVFAVYSDTSSAIIIHGWGEELL